MALLVADSKCEAGLAESKKPAPSTPHPSLLAAAGTAAAQGPLAAAGSC